MIWFMLFLATLLAVSLIINHRPSDPEGAFRYDMRKLNEDMRRRGLNAHEQLQEQTFRYHMTQFRNDASILTIASPDRYNKIIAEEAKKRAEIIALTDPDVAKRFVRVVDNSPLMDILYPSAMNILKDHCKENPILASADLSTYNGWARTVK